MLFIEDRKILVLTDRREHCSVLMCMCQSKYSDDSVGLYIGGMKTKDLKESEGKSIIIGTYTLAHEGLDIPSLDSIILATPKSNIVQAVGRILRETPGKQHNPLIIDVLDKWGPFFHQYKKREKYYLEAGFTINSSKKVIEERRLMFLEDN